MDKGDIKIDTENINKMDLPGGAEASPRDGFQGPVVRTDILAVVDLLVHTSH